MTKYLGKSRSVEKNFLGYMLICQNAEGIHGQRKVGNPWPNL